MSSEHQSLVASELDGIQDKPNMNALHGLFGLGSFCYVPPDLFTVACPLTKPMPYSMTAAITRAQSDC